MWVVFAIISAFFLGFYDIAKKVSLNNNAVIPVLFTSTLVGGIIFLPFIVSSWLGIVDVSSDFYIPFSGFKIQILIFVKTVLVLSSWILSFFALKHLPITIVSPIRSTAPLWTLLGAIFLFGEMLSLLQWVGVLVTFVFFYIFSIAGKKEGIEFKNNKFILFIILATLIGSVCSLYDKYLLSTQSINKLELQSWFSVYQVLIMTVILLVLWYPKRKNTTPFTFRWSILLIGFLLLLADFFYFHAVSLDGALISLISTTRRSNVIISFLVGGIAFKEKYISKKFFILLGIMAGIVLIYVSSK